jgi:hypothetical protein
LGQILVDLGAISARELERQMRFQIEEVVFEMMSWHEGFFSFGEEAVTVPADAVRIRTEAILMEGARRIDEWSRIEKRISHLGVVPQLAPPREGEVGQVDLLPAEWELLALLDGTRNVRTLATELGRSDFDVAKTLFGLESAGVILLVDPGSAKGDRVTTAAQLAELVARAEDALAAKDLGRARAEAEQAAALFPHDATVHLVLGRIQLAAGRPGDAADELRRALQLDSFLVAAYRMLGYALVASGRFAEAVEQWEQWERLASRSDAETAQLDQVRRAKAAAQTLVGAGVSSHG